MRIPRLVLALALVVATIVGVVACSSPEARAEKAYREVTELVRENRISEAIEKLDAIERTYPGTKTAERAHKDGLLYRGLLNAVDRYPGEQARDLMVRTARAIERYRSRHRAAPDSLERLMPEYLPEIPVDPWGNRLDYAREGTSGYRLTSWGADGAPGGSGADADLRVRNGEFVSTRGAKR